MGNINKIEPPLWVLLSISVQQDEWRSYLLGFWSELNKMSYIKHLAVAQRIFNKCELYYELVVPCVRDIETSHFNPTFTLTCDVGYSNWLRNRHMT